MGKFFRANGGILPGGIACKMYGHEKKRVVGDKVKIPDK